MTTTIPTLDIRRYETDRDAFVAELGAAYREWGFAGIRGHGIDSALIGRAYDAFRRFFALPADVKLQYHLEGAGGAHDVLRIRVGQAVVDDHRQAALTRLGRGAAAVDGDELERCRLGHRVTPAAGR